MTLPGGPLAHSGDTPSRLSSNRLLWVFGGGLAVALVIAVIVIFISQPPPPTPPCSEDVVLCPDPPQGGDGESEPPASRPPSTADAFSRGTTWRSPELGYEVDYDSGFWAVARESGTDLVLEGRNCECSVLFEGRPVDVAAPTPLVQARLDIIRQYFPNLTLDEAAYYAIPGTHIGYVDAEGGSYLGTGIGADGVPTTPAGFAVFAAADGRLTILFMMQVDQPDVLIGEDTRQSLLRSLGDDLLKDFRWNARP